MEEGREVSKLLDAAYRYLGYRARTKKEMISYLEKKRQKYNISQNAVDKTIEYLQETGFINDQSFIDLYVSSRSHSKPKSTYALTIELLQKGVESELIDSYFEEHVQDEDTLARKALMKKWEIFKKFSTEKRIKKASDFLRRRGFSYSIIKKTIEELEVEE